MSITHELVALTAEDRVAAQSQLRFLITKRDVSGLSLCVPADKMQVIVCSPTPRGCLSLTSWVHVGMMRVGQTCMRLCRVVQVLAAADLPSALPTVFAHLTAAG